MYKLLIFTVVSFFAFISGTTAQNSADELLQQREKLVNKKKDTRDIDAQLIRYGYRFPAKVTEVQTEAGRVFQFANLLGNTPEEVEKYAAKFTNAKFAGVLAVRFDSKTNQVTLNLDQAITDQQLSAVLGALGYDGYEVR